jgi:hypothetical protein
MNIQDFLTNYEDGTVQIGSNVSYKQRDVINKNQQMSNGQYESKYFEDGETEKYYYNVVHGFSSSLKRGSRLKISEFSLTSLNGKFLRMVGILKGAVKHFLKYNGFIEKKEEVLNELVDMGHVLTKVVDGDTEVVDLRNFVFKPNMRSAKLEGGAEKIFMTYEEARAEFKSNKHWSEIEEFYDKIKDTESDLTFIEYWTVDEFEVNGKKEITKGCKKYLDRSETTADQYDNPTEWEAQLEIDSFVSPHEIKVSNKKDKKRYGDLMRVFPYDEQRLIDVPGRYLGMGTYELCRPAQEDYNEKKNYKRKFDRLALRGILVHKIGNMRTESDGEALTQEFLKRMDTGAALKIHSDESLERLNVGSTTSDTLAMTNDLFEFMRFMLGVTPISIGNDSTNKTASFAVIQNQTQQSTYQVIKNKTARLFERLFQDFLIEDIIEDILSGDIIPIYADKNDLKEMDRFLAKAEVDDQFNRTRPNINEETYNAVVENRALKNEEMGDARFIDIKDTEIKKAFRKMLKEVDSLVEFNITDEAFDPSLKIKTLLDADQMQNEKLRDRVLDIVGVSPKELQESDEEKRKKLQEQVGQERAMTEARNIPETPITPNVQQLTPNVQQNETSTRG